MSVYFLLLVLYSISQASVSFWQELNWLQRKSLHQSLHSAQSEQGYQDSNMSDKWTLVLNSIVKSLSTVLHSIRASFKLPWRLPCFLPKASTYFRLTNYFNIFIFPRKWLCCILWSQQYFIKPWVIFLFWCTVELPFPASLASNPAV